MTRLLGIVVIYGAMFPAWSGVGLFLLFAPGRCGNLIHDSLYLFPAVGPNDWGKKLTLRLAGAALVAFAVRFALGVMQFAAQGG